MSGTLRGSIEHYITSAMQDPNERDHFAAVVNFFDSHPQMTRVASYAGVSPVGAVATALPGYSSGSNYSGRCAFGVWRWDKVNGDKIYILVQWCNWSSGFSNGTPASATSNFGVCVQYAMDTSGGDCWNGGTGNAGADSKGGRFSGSAGVGPVWVPNGGTLLVWPMSNGTGGSYATNKERLVNMMAGYQTAQTPGRFHIMADDDHIFTAWGEGADGIWATRTLFASYLYRNGITPSIGDYLLYAANDYSGDLSRGADIGTLAGTSTSGEGGAVLDPTYGVRTFQFATLGQLTGMSYGVDDAFQQPNRNVNKFDILDLYVYLRDIGQARYGLFGKLDPSFIAAVANVNSEIPNADLSRIVIGSTARGPAKLLIPWDSSTVPRTGALETGVQFP